jgi:lipopolysaccharide/colanic/teichoic acid biosynthesis glycosyltransferase
MSGLVPDSLSPAVGRPPVAKAFRSEARSGVRSRGKWQGLPLVVEEGLFRDAVTREQKRADRFEEPFLLVLVSLKAGRSCDAETWLAVIEALTVAKRDTDILGWFTRGSHLGVIVPEIDANDSNSVLDVESQVQVALTRRLDAETRDDFSVQVHRHAPPTPAMSERRQAADRLLRSLHRSTGARVRSGLKRTLDIAGSALLLLLLSPIFLVIAVLVKLKSPGPVFFRQSRVGEHGRSFTMLKFRTMRVNTDHAIHKEFVSQLINGSSPTGGDSAKEAPFKIVNDPRVTSIGRLLRKTSLDELPQFWNVLRGEMSLVGPRPPLAYEVEQYKSWHYRRVLEAKPGITGLWQINGRSRTSFDDMVRLDLRYAKNPSAWADIKILLATPRAVISGKGAC